MYIYIYIYIAISDQWNTCLHSLISLSLLLLFMKHHFVSGTLHKLFHLIFITTQQGRSYSILRMRKLKPREFKTACFAVRTRNS